MYVSMAEPRKKPRRPPKGPMDAQPRRPANHFNDPIPAFFSKYQSAPGGLTICHIFGLAQVGDNVYLCLPEKAYF